MLQLLRSLALSLPLLVLSPMALAASTTLTFGIVPQQAPSKLAELWGPLLQALSHSAGVELKFATAPSIPEFERRLVAGEYDFAYMNPYHFTVFNQAPGYRAVAKARDKKIKGIVVVRKDSPIQSLKEIAGQQVAFPAPAAFAATLLTQAHLTNNRIDFVPKYVSSHDSVYLTVAKGLYVAGGGIQRTLNNAPPELREQLRVLWTSEGYTPHAIAAHPRVTTAQHHAVQQALVSLSADDHGRALLQALSLKGWDAAADADWDDVRGLNIRILDN